MTQRHPAARDADSVGAAGHRMRVLAAGPASLERLGLFEINLEASSSHNHRHRANQTEQIICMRPTTGLRGQAWRKYSAGRLWIMLPARLP